MEDVSTSRNKKSSGQLSEGQKAYQKFLQTKFWKDLSAKKKKLVGMCEECGSTQHLEAHHTHYPKNWFDTTLEHLQVLCRRHHRKAHGLTWQRLGRILPYRNDERFDRFMHWSGYLRIRSIMRGTKLKDREVKYLRVALVLFPTTESDRCMKYHISKALEFSP